MSSGIPVVGLTTELQIEKFRQEWDDIPAIEKHNKFVVNSILPDNLKMVALVRWTDCSRVLQQQADEIQRLRRKMAVLEEQQ